MVNKNFTLVRGNSLQFRLNITEADALPDNLYFILKNKSSDTESIMQLSLNNGITKVNNADSYDFYIPAADTGELELLNYIYQISILYGTDLETVVEGKLIITPEL